MFFKCRENHIWCFYARESGLKLSYSKNKLESFYLEVDGAVLKSKYPPNDQSSRTIKVFYSSNCQIKKKGELQQFFMDSILCGPKHWFRCGIFLQGTR